MNPENEHDPLLSELLGGIELPPVNPSQRDAVFLQTRGILRRRRLVRQMFQIAPLVACWVFGALSVLAWQEVQHRERNAVRPGGGAIEIKAPVPGETSTVPSDSQASLQASNPSTDAAPSESKLTESLTTFEKMRRAGDRQLNELGNLRGAIGCYRRALEFASDDDLKIVPERDSWLLIPLKEARLETRKHVHKKS